MIKLNKPEEKIISLNKNSSNNNNGENDRNNSNSNYYTSPYGNSNNNDRIWNDRNNSNSNYTSPYGNSNNNDSIWNGRNNSNSNYTSPYGNSNNNDSIWNGRNNSNSNYTSPYGNSNNSGGNARDNNNSNYSSSYEDSYNVPIRKRNDTSYILVIIIVFLLMAIAVIVGIIIGGESNKGGINKGEGGITIESTVETISVSTETTTAEIVTTELYSEAMTSLVTFPPETQISVTVVTVTVLVTEPPKPIEVIPPNAYLYDVKVCTKQTDLNMRSQASTNSTIIGSIPKGTIVPYYGSVGDFGVVKYNNIYGYVSLDYITSSWYDDTPNDYIGTGKVKANGGLNLRSSASKNSSVIKVIPNNSTVYIMSVSGDWYYVYWDGYTGYVSSDYIE